ncbi:MAG: ABC transporter permease [Ruminococcus sp.]|nr:ABC transporter permease [Ruminococcus sp.]
MPQKLSALRYIRNNKRRTAVLIVSLCLCFVLTMLTQFLLSTTEESFRSLLLGNGKKMQFIDLAGSSYGLDVDNLSYEELVPLYQEKQDTLIDNLNTYEGVKAVYDAQILYECLNPVIGQFYFELPLVEKEEIPIFLEHFGAEIIQGRLPEHPGEIVLDTATMANRGYGIGSYADEQNMGELFKIVGILDCDYYFGCGIPSDEYTCESMITVLSDGIDDMTVLLENEGITYREKYDSIVDYKRTTEILEKEVTDVIAVSTQFIFIGIIILLSIALFIVYTTYLRDRHNEWCLYCSIGYSRKTIYLSILRELLFTFAAAIFIGSIMVAVSEIVLYYIMIQPNGLKCNFLHTGALWEIFCSYALLCGILQIPVRYALYRIRTIDAMDDDLY